MKVSLDSIKELMPGSLLDRLAVKFKVNAKNQVRLPGQAVFLCILNGILNHPVLSQRMLEEQYAKLTGESCDHSTFGKRLANIDPEYFRAILDHARSKIAVARNDVRALRLRFVDATIVTLSAKLLDFGIKADHGGKGLRSQVKSVIELSDGGLPNVLRVCREQSEASDVVAIGHTMLSTCRKNDLWVFDKGCHKREVLLKIHQAGAFWLTPHSTQKLEAIETLYQSKSDTPVEEPKKDAPTCWLEIVEYARFDNAPWHRVKGLECMNIIVLHCWRWDSRSKTWKALTLITNLPLSDCGHRAVSFSFEEVVEIYRRRWDIEAFFKMLKHYLNYDHLTSRSEKGIEVMILMSVIAALLMIWYKQQTGIDRGWRSVKFWLAEDAREWTFQELQHLAISAKT